MTPIAILLAAAFLAAGGYWWWSRPSRGRRAPSSTSRTAEHFTAVEIRHRSGACAAARALDGQRFLADQAPALPLTGCTKTRCDCAFAKLSDRRSDDRRFEHGGLSATMFLKAERRRKLGGRRDAD